MCTVTALTALLVQRPGIHRRRHLGGRLTGAAAPPRVGQTTLGAAGRTVGRPSPEKADKAAAAQSENGQPDRAF